MPTGSSSCRRRRPLGVPLAELYGDVVLDVDVKPNRGDALSMVGLAREVVGRHRRARPLPGDRSGRERRRRSTDRLRVEVEEPPLCPRFVGRWVSGVTVGPSPDRVQMRLIAAGQRPISNVVDVSNYVMLELGKPIHTFDAAAVHDGRIIVRPRPRGRAARDPRPRRARAERRRRCSSPTRPVPSGSPGSWAAPTSRSPTRRPTSSSSRRSSIRSASGGRHSGTPCGRRPACASRRARSTASRASVPTGRPGSSPSGPAARSRPASSTRTRTSRRRRVSRSGRRGSTGSWARRSADRGTARPAGAGRDRDRAGPARDADHGRRRRRSRSTSNRAAPRSLRRDRPDLAPRPRDRGGRRRGGRPRPRLRARPGDPAAHADAAVPARPAPPARHRARDARRGRADRGRDVRARLAGDGRAVPAGR